jgi:hypothetical protein
MAKNFGRVNVSISASTGGLTAGLSRASKTLTGFASQVTSSLNPLRMLSSVAQSTFGQLALFSMARGAVNTLLGMGSAAAESADQISKLSRRLGTTYGELAGLKLAGDLAGVGIDTIAAAMTKSDVAMQKAASGSKTATAAFATLGLTAEQLQGMSSPDRFEAIASAISGLATPAERAAAAVALFGRSGAQLLPLFEGGADGIRNAVREANSFGLALTNAQGVDIENMNDSFTRVHSAIQGIIQQVTAYLAPAITAIAKQFTDFVGSVGGANIGQAIGEGILNGARFFAEIADAFIAQAAAVFEYFGGVGAIWSAMWSVAERIGQWFYGVGEFWKAVFQGVAAAIAQVAASLTSAAGQLASSIPGWGKTGAQLEAAGADFQKSANDLGASSRESFTNAGEAITKAIFGGEQGEQMAKAAAGPLTSLLDAALAKARASAAAIDEKSVGNIEQAMAQSPTLQMEVNTAALKAIVAGSSEGEAFRNSLLRGADPRNSGDANQERTADATEETAAGIDELVGVMRDQFALAEITV